MLKPARTKIVPCRLVFYTIYFIDLVVNYTDEKVTLTGDAKLVYTGEAEY